MKTEMIKRSLRGFLHNVMLIPCLQCSTKSRSHKWEGSADLTLQKLEISKLYNVKRQTEEQVSRWQRRDSFSPEAPQAQDGSRPPAQLPPAAHLWIGSAHARQHSWKHVPALVPRPATHRQLEQVHHDTCVVHHQQTSELIQGLKFCAWRFILAFNILKKSSTIKMRNHTVTDKQSRTQRIHDCQWWVRNFLRYLKPWNTGIGNNRPLNLHHRVPSFQNNQLFYKVSTAAVKRNA